MPIHRWSPTATADWVESTMSLTSIVRTWPVGRTPLPVLGVAAAGLAASPAGGAGAEAPGGVAGAAGVGVSDGAGGADAAGAAGPAAPAPAAGRERAGRASAG